MRQAGQDYLFGTLLKPTLIVSITLLPACSISLFLGTPS